MLLTRAALGFWLAALSTAHGSHDSSENKASSWAEYHMIEEHHVSNFDAPSFFTLHDFNGDGSWTGEEVRRFYGLDDESLKDTPADVKDKGQSHYLASYYRPLTMMQPYWTCSRSLTQPIPD